jgi:hypothetical protein
VNESIKTLSVKVIAGIPLLKPLLDLWRIPSFGDRMKEPPPGTRFQPALSLHGFASGRMVLNVHHTPSGTCLGGLAHPGIVFQETGAQIRGMTDVVPILSRYESVHVVDNRVS